MPCLAYWRAAGSPVKGCGSRRLDSCVGSPPASMLEARNPQMLGRLFRKFVAVLALLALLLPVASTLAGTITTAGVPVCCNTNYCPLHHSSRSNPQKDGPNCPGKNVPGPSSTIRACDSTPNPIVG